MMRRRLAGAVAVLLAACGGQEGPSAGPGAGASVRLPAVAVRDVEAGTERDLSDLLPSPRPILLWFWAPH
jgi:hypothetical protein